MSQSTDTLARLRFRGQPLANPDSLVVEGRARLTVLTPRLLRLEWSATGVFEDRGTYAFPTRYAPAPPCTIRRDDGWLTLDTGALTLRYRADSGPFAADNLSIVFDLDGRRQTWAPGQPNPANLRGTRRTLDLCAGDAALEAGLLSRAGWSLFDDSASVLFDPEAGWPAPRPDHALQDWYFFGYGHDYQAALADYVRFGGRIPLIPRYVLGAWWSRYWAYSAEELMDLVRDFEAHDLPLDVVVVDMDWHTPDSWTGYTWNRDLFPDPPAFLRWLHDRGLRVTLNLHPAEGVQAFEEVYPRFARAMGLDPGAGEAIPFRIDDEDFVRYYFELLHHPLEDGGVDFWWIDWQQGEASDIPGLDPLPWLNHLHFADARRRGERPLLYSRWGGLGNHRYPIGFSGDTYVGWPALQFQPYFTATASNVAYGWWSHDIGGHMGGPTEPELYARWVQFGALSPCLRLHATKDPRAERRPWAYPESVYRAAQSAFHWRYQLLPYLYTLARIAHDTGLSLCRPMYYEHPEVDDAYAARYQYYLGDQLIAAPIVFPADPETGLATVDVWLPAGTWIEYTTRETFQGPRWVRLVGGLERLPMLMRSGAILPLAPPIASGSSRSLPGDRLVLAVFSGAEGHFRLYEDDGRSERYRQGEHEWTAITTRMDEAHTWLVHVDPVEGHCPALPRQRGYEIRLEGSRRPERVVVDGLEVSDWSYDPDLLRTTIHVPRRDKDRALTITAIAAGPAGVSALGKAHNRQLIEADLRQLLGARYRAGADEATLLEAALQAGPLARAGAIARLGGPTVRFLEFSAPEEAAQHLGRIIVGGPARDGETYDLEADWTLERGPDRTEHTVRREAVTGPLILEAPFAFDGRLRPALWTAEVRLTWRGRTWTCAHCSDCLFPTVYTWRAIVYDRDRQPLALEQVMSGAGEAGGDLDWRLYSQSTTDLINVYQPHAVDFSREYWEAQQAGEPLAAYLATTVLSPIERQVALFYHTRGPVDLYLNGQRLETVAVEEQAGVPIRFRGTCRTETVTLRPGRNSLLVHSQAPSGDGDWWYFAAGVMTPGGEWLTDLDFE